MVRIYAVVSLLCVVSTVALPAFASDKELTLKQAVTLALENNPGLRVLRLEEESAKGQIEKARMLLINNPEIESSFSKKDRPDEEGGGEFTNYGFKLSQEFEVAGQRGARINVAQKELARVKSEIRDRERILIADVKDAFTKALSLRKKSSLAREVVSLNDVR
jgi:cobalt-zinc-cadmium efflux system outer membrane protein